MRSSSTNMEIGSREGVNYFKFNALLQRDKWISPAYVGVDVNGKIVYLSDNAPSEGFAMESLDGYAIPGFQNAHSHAFQYGMASLAETHPAGIHDDFWTWREAMYQCALSVNPEQVEAIATMLYSEMVRHGYTQVAEFHYLHHDKDGKPYSNLAELGERIVSAAEDCRNKNHLGTCVLSKGNVWSGSTTAPKEIHFENS